MTTWCLTLAGCHLPRMPLDCLTCPLFELYRRQVSANLLPQFYHIWAIYLINEKAVNMFVHVVVIMSLGRVLDDKASMEFSRLAPCECPRPSENVALAPLVLATTDPTQPPTEDSGRGSGQQPAQSRPRRIPQSRPRRIPQRRPRRFPQRRPLKNP